MDTAPQQRSVARDGFNFTVAMQTVCLDVCDALDEFAHVEMRRVAIRFCQSRRQGPYGVQASLTPLRFAGGARETVRRGRRWSIQRVCNDSGDEMLYLLSFYLPRFLDLSLTEKLATICHELWHIGPTFDGDIRRHDGRCYAHGHSEKQFHASMYRLVEKWQARSQPEVRHGWLSLDFAQLQSRYGRVFGVRITTPKMIRLHER